MIAAILLVLLGQCRARSFYDNPDQDPLPAGERDLHQKWDFEVWISTIFYSMLYRSGQS